MQDNKRGKRERVCIVDASSYHLFFSILLCSSLVHSFSKDDLSRLRYIDNERESDCTAKKKKKHGRLRPPNSVPAAFLPFFKKHTIKMPSLSAEASCSSQNPHSTPLIRDENPHRQTDAVLFPCATHGKAAVLCVRAGKIGRQRHQAAIGATVFWLTCPSLNNALAHLEQGGVVQVLNRLLTSSSTLAAAHSASHAVFTACVETLLTREVENTDRTVSPAEKKNQGTTPRKDAEERGSPSSSPSGDAEMAKHLLAYRFPDTSSSSSPSSSSLTSSRASYDPTSLWEVYRRQFVSPAEERNTKYGNSGSCHRTTIKCLHALVAQELCGARNPIGETICNYVYFLHQLFYPAHSSSSPSSPPLFFSFTAEPKTNESKKRKDHAHSNHREAPKDGRAGQAATVHSGRETEGKEGENGAPKSPSSQRWQATLLESVALFENFLSASLLSGDFSSSSSSSSSCLSGKESTAKGENVTLCVYPASGARVVVSLPPLCTASTSSSSSSVVEYHWKVLEDFRKEAPTWHESRGGVDGRGERHDGTPPPLDLCRVAHEVVVAAKGKDRFSKKRRIN